MLPAVLSVSNLRKQYGGTVAVDGLSFTVARREIVGLLGPNGAGKTTTINMILGVLEPDSGTVRIEDVDLAKHRSQALERTNFVAVYSPLPGNLTVAENLRFFGLIYGVGNLTERIEALLGQFDLLQFRRREVRRPFFRRANPRQSGEGDDQSTEPAVARRTNRVARSLGGARRTDQDPRSHSAG